MRDDYVPPERNLDGFNCPQCHAYAHQVFYEGIYAKLASSPGYMPIKGGFTLSRCAKCDGVAFWKQDRLFYPEALEAPSPNPDMPEDALKSYEEASLVASRSPAAAAALLRLSVEQLVIYLQAEGKDLNARIGFLVRQGLPPTIQQALDIVRVTGNGAVHPGMLVLSDKPEIARRLFGLVNEIVENRLSQPRRMEELYAELPQGKRDGIAERDGAAPTAEDLQS